MTLPLDVPVVPWTKGPEPDASTYTEAELFVAGALSTMHPFSGEHPVYALPFARTALEAMSRWDPTDSRGADEPSQDYIDTANCVLG